MKMKLLCVMGVVAMACLATYASAGEAEWPGWRGANRDGKSPDTGLLKEWPKGGPPLLWKSDKVGKGYSSVSVADGRIYMLGDFGKKLRLLAFDMEGNVLWQKDVDDAWAKNYQGSRCTPTYDNGRLYVLSGRGVLACHDAKTGEQIWKQAMTAFGGRAPRWGYSESPLIIGDLVVVMPGGRNAFVALNKADGKRVWVSSGFSATAHYSSCIAVTLDGVPIIINGTGSGIFAVSPKDGSLLWSNKFCDRNTANCPTPAYADGHVFWANGYRKGGISLKLSVTDDKATAKQAWTTLQMDCHHGGYIIHEGHIYGNHSNRWNCLELETGKVKWSEPGVGKGSVCYADGMLYLFGERGGQVGLATCSPEKMEMKGRFKVAGSGPSWAHPVVIGGRLYIRYDKNLYCYDVKAK
jgi:outer membrane protein assembly factor BamB